MSVESDTENFKKLTKNEVTLLYWKFREKPTAEICKLLAVEESEYYRIQRSAYKKLEVDMSLSTPEKWNDVKTRFGDLLTLLTDEDLKSWKEKTSPTPEEPSIPKEEPKEHLEVPDRVETGNRRALWLGVGFMIILALVGGYYLGAHNSPPRQIVITATLAPVSQATTNKVVPTTRPTERILLTSTESPTDTIAPTDTTAPTDTPTIAPTLIPLPFQDNFNNGLNPMWNQLTGTWRVINGQLTADPDDSWSRILVGDTRWTNFRVDVDVFNYDWNYQVEVIAHATPQGFISFRTNGDGSSWMLHKIGSDEETIASLDKGGLTFSGFDGYAKNHIRLEVNGNTYSAYVDGQLYLQVTDPTFPSGQAGLGIYFPNSHTHRFDNFSIEALP